MAEASSTSTVASAGANPVASAVPKPPAGVSGTGGASTAAPARPHGPRPVTPATSGNGGVARPPSSTGGGSRVAGAGGDAPRPPGGGSAKPPSGGGGGGAAAAPAPAVPGMPPIDQLQQRPIGRVLTKMGKVTRDQVVEALTFQKSKGGAL